MSFEERETVTRVLKKGCRIFLHWRGRLIRSSQNSTICFSLQLLSRLPFLEVQPDLDKLTATTGWGKDILSFDKMTAATGW